MPSNDLSQIVNFLRENLKLSDDSVQLALKQSRFDYNSLPMVLWQYGLIDLAELDRVYDWFEACIY